MKNQQKTLFRMHFEPGDLIKLPNILCYIRIILVPVFCWLYLNAGTPHDFAMAAVVVIVSGLTDFLDGQIARRCNMITDLGKVLDPIAISSCSLQCLYVQRYVFTIWRCLWAFL